MKSCRHWWSTSIVTKTQWGCFSENKAAFRGLLFPLENIVLWQWNLHVFYAFCCLSVKVLYHMFVTWQDSGPDLLLVTNAITFQPVTDKLTIPYYCQHCGHAEVLKALSCSIKGRINLLIYFAAFWTLGCLFHVNEIQSLCNSRGFLSLTILQQRLGMETWSHKYGLKPCCQGHSAFSEQKGTAGQKEFKMFSDLFLTIYWTKDIFCLHL